MYAYRRSPWVVFRRVIYALLIRELKTRFGAQRFGMFWVLADPIIQVGVMVAMFGLVSKHVMPNIDYAVYVALGIIPWFMFSDVVTRGMAAVDANRGLLVFRQVKPLDTFIARALLELLTYIVVFVVVIGLLAVMGFEMQFKQPLHMLAAYTCLFLMACGFGLAVMAASVRFPESKKLVPVVLRFGYFVSGVIMPMSAIPSQYRDYFYWNPVVHIMEISREAFFPAFHGVIANWWFVGYTTLALVFVGMASYHVAREEILES